MEIIEKVLRIQMIVKRIKIVLRVTIRKEMFEYVWYHQVHPNPDLLGTNLWKWEDLAPQKNQLVSKHNQILGKTWLGKLMY